MPYIDKLIFESLPENSAAIRFHQLADFLMTPLRVVSRGRTYCVNYSNNSLTEISRIKKKTSHCAKRIFAFLATIVFSPFVLIGLAIKLVLKDNPTIQQIWNYRSQSSLTVEGGWECEKIKGQPSNNFYYKNDILAYSGQKQGNVPHGQGLLYHFGYGTKRYDGSWSNGQRDGQGTIYHPNGTKSYEGSFSNGDYHGQGIEYHSDGTKVYEGSFSKYWRDGQGTSYFTNGKKNYEGLWKKGKHGDQGTFYHSDGTKAYEGTLQNGYRKQGTSYRYDGTKAYEGSWNNSLPDDQGIEYDATGTVEIYNGLWKNGTKLVNGSWVLLDPLKWKGALPNWYRLAYPNGSKLLDGVRVPLDPNGKALCQTDTG